MKPFLMHMRRSCVMLMTVLALASTVQAEEPVLLVERFAPGYQYHVSTRVDLSGSLTLPTEKGKPASKPLNLNGDSAIEYDERVLTVDKNGLVQKTIRLCRRTDFRRTVASRPQESNLRSAVRRLVILRRDHKEVPFSPDGPLTWGEIDLIRTDVFTPALAGLLTDRPVHPGDHWTASEGAVRELTDLERIDEGKIECRLEQVTLIEGRRYARITLGGTVHGLNEDGPNRQQLEGYTLFDLESNHLSYLYLKGIHVMLDKDGREVGRVEGRFVLKRQAGTRCPELSDEALKGVTVDPDANNTLLLYDNPDLGVRFLYPRRWHIASVRGNQVTLDSAEGSGILLTVDPPARALTGAQFQAESRDWLAKQKVKLLREEPVRRVQSEPALEQFALEAELGGQKFLMDYYVTRQSSGGATLAARLLPGDQEALRREVEKLARSVMVTKPQNERTTEAQRTQR